MFFKKKLQKREYIQCFRKLMNDFFLDHGFKNTSGICYLRESEDVSHAIEINPMYRDGEILHSADVGVDYKPIEELMKLSIGTVFYVGTPLHLLRPSKEYYLWAFDSEASLKYRVKDLQGDFLQYAFPYFDQARNSQELFAAIQSEGKNDLKIIPPIQNNEYQVLATYLEKGVNEAIA